jgi:hypothetical protein
MNFMKTFFGRPILTILLTTAVLAGPAAFGREVTLRDKSLIVAFDADSGALTRLESKSPSWKMQGRPDQGVSFRLTAETPDHQDTVVLGQKQRAVEVKKLSRHQVQLRWQNLVTERGDTLPITLTAVVS